jgi:hypothetical protein
MGRAAASDRGGDGFMIDSTQRYELMLQAATSLPEELLDVAASLLGLEPRNLLADARVSKWLDVVYADLPLAAHSIDRPELVSYIHDRLRVHIAAEAARRGDAPAVVLDLMWPADRNREPRLGVASSAEASLLWPAAKLYLQGALTRPPWNGIVEIFTDDTQRVSALQADPPEYESYYDALQRLAYDKLDDRFRDALECGATVEPGWVEINILPQLPPAGAFAYVASLHEDLEALLDLVRHPSDAIAFAALMRFEDRRSPDEDLRYAARELRHAIARGHQRPEAVEALASDQQRLQQIQTDLLSRLFAVLAQQPARYAHRLARFAADGSTREAAARAILSLDAADLAPVVRSEIARARSTATWVSANALADAVRDVDVSLRKEVLSAHEQSWRTDASRSSMHLPLLRAGMLIDEFELVAVEDPDAFRASLRDQHANLLRRLEGRYLALDTERIDEVLSRLYAIGRVARSTATFRRDDLLDALRLTTKLVRRWRGLHAELLDALSASLLGSLTASDAREIGLGADLLRAANENDDLSHVWPRWTPEEATLRRALLAETHTRFLHVSARFLAQTTRKADGEANVYKVLVDSGCGDCENAALRRLVDLRGEIAPLAEAILVGRNVEIEKRVQSALLLSFPLVPLQRFRSSLIDVAARRSGVQIDMAAYTWVRHLEQTGLVDNATEWSWRRR